MSDDSGISPVVGVILMVAVTVILSAVIGAFVFDLSGNMPSDAGPPAGIQMNVVNPDTGEVKLTVVSSANAENLYAETPSGHQIPMSGVGSTTDVHVGSGERINVFGTVDGEKKLMGSFEPNVNTDNPIYSHCQEIKEYNSSATSGTYTISPSSTGALPSVYCEMSPDTGNDGSSYGASGGPVNSEYTLMYVESGIGTSKTTDDNTCKQNGLILFQPRGPDEYDVGRNYVIDDYNKSPSNWKTSTGGLGPLGVHISIDGESGTSEYPNDDNFDAEKDRIMKSDHYGTPSNTTGEDDLYGMGTDGWRTVVSQRFWVAESAVDTGEPNGDYNAYGWLGWQSYDSSGYVTGHNDLNDYGYTYDQYLCVHPNSLDA